MISKPRIAIMHIIGMVKSKEDLLLAGPDLLVVLDEVDGVLEVGEGVVVAGAVAGAGAGAGAMVTEYGLKAVCELESLTVMVKLYVAAVVGVPDMVPVLPRVVPVGRVPSVSFHV
jgi:hypothetical protein